ncbi:hypothetical protein AGR7A_pTi0019 [Agrobacterium deltaense NCPPB 1641]|uniref:Uncharacterized protein n=1 Tax=Agrobacterium deltaense NCPPB 1641 TaxID=1183425 RepID=A0A1S7UBM8_9HYPH|nr:hypothetical protein AGR7A_pTi0019 [Agrobacterium deltaense NCPPB 1641]
MKCPYFLMTKSAADSLMSPIPKDMWCIPLSYACGAKSIPEVI